MGATNTLDRVSASIGLLDGVDIKFQPALDIPNGGVLFALPALLACGLLQYTGKHFSWPKGYYQMPSIFLLLSFMALCRLRSVEQLRYHSPGEWGKLLGLDRAPEVRTVREKIRLLSERGQAGDWSADLCRKWMEESPEDAFFLYIDGHVRVYHGHQTKLPRHYVARQRLCLRVTTDYWVNAMDGQPFFLISKAVDPGLIKVLEEEIVPQLEKDVPNQPTAKEFDVDLCSNPGCQNILAKKRYTQENDSLVNLWHDLCFLNPPFRRTKDFVGYGVTQGFAKIWAIFPFRTETKYQQDFILKNKYCLFAPLRKGLQFLHPGTKAEMGEYKNPLCICYFEQNETSIKNIQKKWNEARPFNSVMFRGIE